MFKIARYEEDETDIKFCLEAEVPYELAEYLSEVAASRGREYSVIVDHESKKAVAQYCGYIFKEEEDCERCRKYVEAARKYLSAKLEDDLREAARLKSKFERANVRINELFVPVEDLDPAYEVLGSALDVTESLEKSNIDRLVEQFSPLLGYVYIDATPYFGIKSYSVKVLRPENFKDGKKSFGCLTAVIKNPYIYLIDELHCEAVQLLRLKPVGEDSELWVVMDGVDMYPCEAGCKCGSDSPDCEELVQ